MPIGDGLPSENKCLKPEETELSETSPGSWINPKGEVEPLWSHGPRWDLMVPCPTPIGPRSVRYMSLPDELPGTTPSAAD